MQSDSEIKHEKEPTCGGGSAGTFKDPIKEESGPDSHNAGNTPVKEEPNQIIKKEEDDPEVKRIT